MNTIQYGLFNVGALLLACLIGLGVGLLHGNLRKHDSDRRRK